LTDAFDKWINSFSDDEYEEMLDESNPFGFTDAQQSKALNIRSAPTPEQLEDLELEQEFEEPLDVDDAVKEAKEIDRVPSITRIEQIRREPIQIEQVRGAPIQIEPTIGIEGIKMTRPPIPIQPRVIPPKPPQFVTQIKSAILGAGKFIRRFFRV